MKHCIALDTRGYLFPAAFMGVVWSRDPMTFLLLMRRRRGHFAPFLLNPWSVEEEWP